MASLVLALLPASVAMLAAGCGSSSSSNPRSDARLGTTLQSRAPTPLQDAAPEAERSFEQQTSRAEKAYGSQVKDLCAKIDLPHFSPHRVSPQETSEEARTDIKTLEYVRKRIDRLRALPFMRADRQTYLHVLASALLLDRRIAADGDEGSVPSEAMTQHEDNSQRRSEIAERLKIKCLVQSEPT